KNTDVAASSKISKKSIRGCGVTPSEEGVTAGIAGTTGSGDPLPLIHPPEGGRISLMLLLRNVKSGPLGAACKKSRSNPH
ncbi:hypothetical protein CYQ64_13025, partial [Enterococcus faecium]